MRPGGGRWTRRKFLAAAAAGTAAAAAGAGAHPSPPKRAPAEAPPFSPAQKATLAAAADEIVPAGDGMPAAVEAGAWKYLEDLARSDADVRRDLTRAATFLVRAARPKKFAAATPERRVELLAALESREPAAFAALRDLVYEGYYTSPDVWRLLGFEFYGPERPGPGLAAFDETALDRVRSLPPLYRRAP